MNLRSLSLLVGALLAAGAAHAQVGVYGTITGARIGGVNCPSFASPCAQTDGNVKPYGTQFGAFYDFRNVGPMRLGIDVRGQALVSNKRADSSLGGNDTVRHDGVLVGARGSFHTRIKALTPYVEIAGGLDRNNDTGLYTNTTTVLATSTVPVSTSILSYNSSRYSNYGVVEGFAGLEVRLGPLVSFRAIELGLGDAFGSVTASQSTVIQQNTAGVETGRTTTTLSSSPSSHLITSIGVGVVFHFGR